MNLKKTIAVIGATGNQGGSVANFFSTLPEWHVRGITRDASKPSAAKLAEKGIELVEADIDSPSTLKAAFSGANLIFSVTDTTTLFRSPTLHEEAAKRGITINEVAYEREVQQGKNIVDAAAATTETLDRFVLSTLSESRRWSKGTITFNFHFDSKWKAVEYCKEKYPELWKKTSLIQLGYYADNWKGGMGLPKKGDDGKFVLSMPMGGDSLHPIVDTAADTGRFVQSLLSLPPNVDLIACGSHITWKEYAAIWGRLNNVEVTLQSYPPSVLEQRMGTIGKELGEMYEYMEKFGLDGGDPDVLYPWQAKEKYGVDVPYTTIEEYFKKQDWTPYL